MRLLLFCCFAFLLPGCDALSDTTGACEGGDQPELSLRAYEDLGAGSFRAEAREETLSGETTFRVDSITTGGELRAVGVVELGETPQGGAVIRIESFDLLSVEDGETVSISVSYADSGDPSVPFSGDGELLIRRSTPSEVEGVFASCTDRYPFSALWPQKAKVEGGFRAERR